jgi:hypothetical protein
VRGTVATEHPLAEKVVAESSTGNALLLIGKMINKWEHLDFYTNMRLNYPCLQYFSMGISWILPVSVSFEMGISWRLEDGVEHVEWMGDR